MLHWAFRVWQDYVGRILLRAPHRRLCVSCVSEQTSGFYKRTVTCFCSSIAPTGCQSWVVFDDIDMASETVQHIVCSYSDMFGARVRFLATYVLTTVL